MSSESSDTCGIPQSKAAEEIEHIYQIPQKGIKSPMDMGIWEKSECYYEIIGFINAVSVSVQGKMISHVCEMSPCVIELLKMFDVLNKLVEEAPVIEQPQRFGNKAYRTWFANMKDIALELVQKILPENLQTAAPELSVYLTESFGNPTRIDYGTGHEFSFIMFLCCLFKIGALKNEQDKVPVALKVFNAYLIFVRKLQLTYRMEPAGSHGVWSLDDYQFVPFIWGSAQFAVNSPIEPVNFLDDEVIEEYKSEYIFISCIDYIKKVKTGLFAEHSNQLWSISAVQSWNKINSGLTKMYQKELLGKFPVVQHVLFGSLLTLKPVKPKTLLPNVRLGMLPPSIVPKSNIGAGDAK